MAKQRTTGARGTAAHRGDDVVPPLAILIATIATFLAILPGFLA